MNAPYHVSDSSFLAQVSDQACLPLFNPICDFSFKVEIGDFCVNELMGFEPTGSGEHGIFEITKFDRTTHDVLRYASKQFCVPQRDIGYAGLKDKVAVTTQWISVPLKRDSVPLDCDSGSMHIRFLGRHRQKLRPGCHQGNAFSIILRDVVGDKEAIEARLCRLQDGFPNVFGLQRFGYGFSNLSHFARWKKGEGLKRQAKQLAVSAVRSMGFNQAVAGRWRSSHLRTVRSGDWLMWYGSKSVYLSSGGGVDQQRLDSGEVDLAFPLVDENVLWHYAQECGAWPSWSFVMNNWIEHVAQWRRAWVKPQRFSWRWEGPHLSLLFQLEKGAFATTLISSLGRSREHRAE